MFGLPIILSVVTLSPLVGIFFLLFMDRDQPGLAKMTALLSSILTFCLSIPLLTNFNSNTADFQFVEKYDWISYFGIQYHLGLDGISLFLVMLTTFLMMVTILSTWTAIEKYAREFMISLLALQVGMIGVFLSLDVFLFYVFWEVMLIPMYLLIGIWGGDNRFYASIKFFLYTMAGSVLMLVAIITMAILYKNDPMSGGTLSFNLLDWYKITPPATIQFWMFAAFAIAFAIKVPMFPVHTWLPDAHVQAPTAGSVILAGVLLKMGTYGFIRFALPLFPEASHYFSPFLMFLSVVGIIYGALVAMIQPDMKKLVAYSSVSHMGFVMLGVFSLNIQGLQGAMLQMLNHGISTSALFIGVGILYERRHTKMISDYGGIVKVMPIYTVIFLIVTFSSIGLPGLNGFVGEFMIMVGAFKASPILTAFASLGVIFAAVYMLWMCQRVFFGTNDNVKNHKLKDLSLRELVVFIPLIFFIVYIGVYPKPFFDRMDVSLTHVLEQINAIKVVVQH